MERQTPTDAVAKGKYFYIIRNKDVFGMVQPNGRYVQFLYQDCGRMLTAARIIGNVQDEEIIRNIATAEGFRKVVKGIGITASYVCDSRETADSVNFAIQFYGKSNPYLSGATGNKKVPLTGAEEYLSLDDIDFTGDEDLVGQIRFEFPEEGMAAKVSVKYYLNDGFEAPEEIPDKIIDFRSPEYAEMIDRSIVNYGNLSRLKKAIDNARAGKDVTVAYIGGSITQGAGGIPINVNCYAYKSYVKFCELCGRKPLTDNIKYVKAGVGGTPSELGMIRYDRDVTDYGRIKPDVVIIEFAVNDADDETGGVCFESLVKKVLEADNKPAVIIPFEVFADDFNLQDRLAPIGFKFNLPMLSLKNAVLPEFYLSDEKQAVLLKNNYFYDQFHPTNDGHTICADAFMKIFEKADKSEYTEDIRIPSKPVYGFDFTDIRLLDRQDTFEGSSVSCGSFTETDKVLQSVERNYDLTTTPEFPYNWHHTNGNDPFVLNIRCSKLLIVFKDSNAIEFGKAVATEDDKVLLEMDPLKVGWTHCHAAILFNENETKDHKIVIRMKEGEESKLFTILGFAYVA